MKAQFKSKWETNIWFIKPKAYLLGNKFQDFVNNIFDKMYK